MSILDLMNKIAKEEAWAHETYEEWVNHELDYFEHTTYISNIGFFCIIDNLPVGNESR